MREEEEGEEAGEEGEGDKENYKVVILSRQTGRPTWHEGGDERQREGFTVGL